MLKLRADRTIAANWPGSYSHGIARACYTLVGMPEPLAYRRHWLKLHRTGRYNAEAPRKWDHHGQLAKVVFARDCLSILYTGGNARTIGIPVPLVEAPPNRMV